MVRQKHTLPVCLVVLIIIQLLYVKYQVPVIIQKVQNVIIGNTIIDISIFIKGMIYFLPFMKILQRNENKISYYIIN